MPDKTCVFSCFGTKNIACALHFASYLRLLCREHVCKNRVITYITCEVALHRHRPTAFQRMQDCTGSCCSCNWMFYSIAIGRCFWEPKTSHLGHGYLISCKIQVRSIGHILEIFLPGLTGDVMTSPIWAVQSDSWHLNWKCCQVCMCPPDLITWKYLKVTRSTQRTFPKDARRGDEA